MRFSKVELRDLAICWLALGICFSSGTLFNRVGDPLPTSLMNFLVILLFTLITMGAGFILHELSHKLISQQYGCWAEFRIWKQGLIISIASAMLSFGSFIFFAPGAVHTLAYRSLSKKEEGIISAAGPITNLVLAALFYVLYSFRHSFGAAGNFMWYTEIFNITFKSYTFNAFTLIGRLGFQLNLWLAAFNLIPFAPLDGLTVFRWNKIVWGIMAVLSWGLILLIILGVSLL